MLKDKKVWVGIILTVLFLGYFLKGMSFFGIPGGERIVVQVDVSETALDVIVHGRTVVSERAPAEGMPPPALANLPDSFRWSSRAPGSGDGGLAGVVEYQSIQYGVTDLSLADIRAAESKGIPPSRAPEASYGGVAGWGNLEWEGDAPSAPIAGPLSLVTEPGAAAPSVRGAVVERGAVAGRGAAETVFLRADLTFRGVPEGAAGTGFYFGDDAGNGYQILFSDEWASAWVLRVSSGEVTELGRVSGIWPALKKAQYIWLIPASFFLALSLYFRAFRWRIFFGDLNRTSIPRLFGVISIGFLGNAVLPLRAGELIRAWLGGKENNCRFSVSLGTLVVERLFDAIAMVGLLVFVLVVAEFPNVNEEWLALLKKAGNLFGIALAGIVVFLFALTFQRDLALQMLHRCTGFLPLKLREKIWQMADAFADGLSALRSPSKLLWCTLHTALVWASVVISEYFVLVAFGLGGEVGLIGATFVMVVICFMIAAPSSPGYVGIFHTAIKVSLVEFYGVAASTAMGCAIVLHASQMAFIILLGAASMLLMGVSFREMKQHTQEGEGAADSAS